MDRVVTTDGRWFDRDKAAVLAEEGTRWDGRNHISRATGDQWLHEQLMRTASGAYVLCRWSDWQGTRASYEVIGEHEASRWVTKFTDLDPATIGLTLDTGSMV